MSTYERSILSIIDPTIEVDEILIEDQESIKAEEQRSESVDSSTLAKSSSRQGAVMPLVVINSNMFAVDEIKDFSLSIRGRLPTINIFLKDVEGKFDISSPLDGDIISLYIRPPDIDNQKPIRIDFDIISIFSDPEYKTYSFNGIMKIPGWDSEVCSSLEEDTSFEHLISICQELGIGFASNESSTEDSMTRICPYQPRSLFVEDIVASTYKNDDSFFDWYIDPFYYLCLVNVNKQFSLEDKTEPINISTTTPLSAMIGDKDAPDTIKGSLILTNETSKSGMNIYIESFSTQNRSGDIWKTNGYKRYPQWWQIGEDESSFEEVFVDPFTTKGAEKDFILLKGRSDEKTYQDQIKYKWLGKQASISEGGNVHDNYQYARILNLQNIEEVNKTTIVVILAGINFYIYRYQRLPIIIYNQGNTKKSSQLQERDNDLGESDENPDKTQSEGWNKASADNNPEDKPDVLTTPEAQVKNEFLSGYYIVNDIEYTWASGGPIKQKLTLIRREWPIPAKNKTQ